MSIRDSSACRCAMAGARVTLAIAALAPTAAAQVVRGTVVDETSGRPVPGVVVVLFDSAGHRLGGVLAGDDGRYAIRATGAGRYRLRAERIGFRADAPTAVTLSAGEAIELKLVTRPVPVVLGEVRVAAKSPCVARATDGREVSAVWEEARKALYATEITQRQELFSARVVRYVRTLDARDAGLPASNVVLLFDVLHLMKAADQERLLAAVLESLRPGGVVVIREADAGAGWRFAVVRAGNRIKALAVGEWKQTFHFRTTTEWMACLERLGFSAEVRQMGQGTPFGNVLFRASAAASLPPTP